MPSIKVRDNEPFEVAIRRFKRTCEKAGIISEMRRHEYYEKPKWVRKREKAQAKKRWQKKLHRGGGGLQTKRRSSGDKTGRS